MMFLEHDLTATSGAGKTQFLLGLLLATQLPPPHGLSRSALYISTESAIPTTRLSQMLSTHSILVSASPKPSLDRVISIVTPDLESQDHILRYQLPVAIRRHNIGLVVLDSVAANYRAEFERPGASKNGANMAKRLAPLPTGKEFYAELRQILRIGEARATTPRPCPHRKYSHRRSKPSRRPLHRLGKSQIWQQSSAVLTTSTVIKWRHNPAYASIQRWRHRNDDPRPPTALVHRLGR
jgi:hypothetical protein